MIKRRMLTGLLVISLLLPAAAAAGPVHRTGRNAEAARRSGRTDVHRLCGAGGRGRRRQPGGAGGVRAGAGSGAGDADGAWCSPPIWS